MKIEPTEIDLAAANVFMPQHGMVIMDRFSDWWRSKRVDDSFMEDFGGDPLPPGNAIDTEDPATVGQMLAQVEALRPGQAVSIVDRLRSLPGEDERRFAVMVEHDGAQTVATGPTRGAALVAAMRAIAEALR